MSCQSCLQRWGAGPQPVIASSPPFLAATQLLLQTCLDAYLSHTALHTHYCLTISTLSVHDSMQLLAHGTATHVLHPLQPDPMNHVFFKPAAAAPLQHLLSPSQPLCSTTSSWFNGPHVVHMWCTSPKGAS